MRRRSKCRQGSPRVTLEEVKLAIEFARSGGPPVLKSAQLGRRITAWEREWGGRALGRLSSVEEIFQTPARAAILEQKESEKTRPDVVFDKASGEFIEFRSRGVKLFNSLSLAGVEVVELDGDAEEWARSRLSGRKLRSDGTIG